MLKYHRPVTLPNYSFVFDFESNFDHRVPAAWFRENFMTGVYCTAIYVSLIFWVQHCMKKRSRFEVKSLLVIWNILLAVFSFLGTIRTLPEFITILSHHGLQHSLCVPSYIAQDKVSGFWSCIFAFSKLLELGDTFFIVLKKQPLIFLHWYHHVTVLLYTWMSFSELTGNGRWFVVMNYCVHTVMYTYYALKAMKFNPPRQLAMVITSLQIVQMVIGCMVNLKVYQYLKNNKECSVTLFNVKCCAAMYLSYFILFARFFYKSYLDKHKEIKKL